MSYLERTPEVQAKLASGEFIVEMHFEHKEPVERLVACKDVKDTVDPKSKAWLATQRRSPMPVAEARKLGLIPGDPYRDTRPIAPPHVAPAHIVGITQDSPSLARAKRRAK